MKSISLLSICVVLMIGAGCASINESWMKSYVALHDAADTAISNNPPVEVFTPADKPVTVTQGTILAFSGTYSQGAKAKEDGPEIWISNWNRMNIRVHVNPGELTYRKGPWYPLNTSVMPNGTVILSKTATGCTLTAKDFISTNGQAYRFEGWRCDGLGPDVQKVYTVTFDNSQMHGACFAWYLTVK